MTPWDNHAPKRRKTAISNIEKLRFTECVPMNQRLKFNILRGIHERELKQPFVVENEIFTLKNTYKVRFLT